MGKKRYWRPQTRAILQVLSWTVCLIGGLTLANFLFVLHLFGPGLQLDQIPLELARGPASENLPGKAADELTQTPVLSLNCKTDWQDQKMETRAPTMRIKFFECPQIEKIINATNASQGHVFKIKNGWLTSDFIFLSKGQNDVFIRFAEKTLKVEVQRQDKERQPSAI